MINFFEVRHFIPKEVVPCECRSESLSLHSSERERQTERERERQRDRERELGSPDLMVRWKSRSVVSGGCAILALLSMSAGLMRNVCHRCNALSANR